MSLTRPARSRFRWAIVGCLFAASAINYLDRQMIGLLKPTLQPELGWNELDSYAPIFFTCASMHLLALASIHLLLPRYRPVDLEVTPA